MSQNKIRMAVIPIETSASFYKYLNIDIPYVCTSEEPPQFYATMSHSPHPKSNRFSIEYPEICLLDNPPANKLLSLEELEVMYMWLCGEGVLNQLLHLWNILNPISPCKIDTTMDALNYHFLIINVEEGEQPNRFMIICSL